MAITSSEGFLLVDKPAGLSSHDVVAMVRRARGGIRAGHTGTLDPFATGLLLVALGGGAEGVPGHDRVRLGDRHR
jgi:tRNA pseudouridine55 synthase